MNEIEVADNLSEEKLDQLYGIEVDIDKGSRIVLKIKACISEYIDNQKLELEMSLPKFIISKTGKNYRDLNNTFLQETGMSIVKYFKWRKLNLAVKLLMHYNLTINEISIQLNYKDEKELLRQFKDEIGIIPERIKS